jgi:flagellar motor switch protein FliM
MSAAATIASAQAPSAVAATGRDVRHQLKLPTNGLVGSYELGALRRRHMELATTLRRRLSAFMRSEVTVEFGGLECMTQKQWIEGLAMPSHLTLFKIEPLRGMFLLEIPPVFGLTIVDRLMGGPGQVPPSQVRLSEIETALLDEVVQISMEEWTRMWNNADPMRPSLLGHEMDVRALLYLAHDSPLLDVLYNVQVGACQGHFHLGIPYPALAPLIRLLGRKGDSLSAVAPARPQWNAFFDDMRMRMRVCLEGVKLPARALADLKPGDVLPLDPDWTRQATVKLANQPLFRASIGASGGKRAVELTELLEDQR